MALSIGILSTRHGNLRAIPAGGLPDRGARVSGMSRGERLPVPPLPSPGGLAAWRLSPSSSRRLRPAPLEDPQRPREARVDVDLRPEARLPPCDVREAVVQALFAQGVKVGSRVEVALEA